MQGDARLVVAQGERAATRGALAAAERVPLADERPSEPEREQLLADPGRALEAIGVVHTPARERALDGLDRGRLAPDVLEAHRGSSQLIAPKLSRSGGARAQRRSEEHTSELQSRENLVCR